jgi:hypothetical protein
MQRACNLGHGVPDFAAGLTWQDDEFLLSRKLKKLDYCTSTYRVSMRYFEKYGVHLFWASEVIWLGSQVLGWTFPKNAISTESGYSQVMSLLRA